MVEEIKNNRTFPAFSKNLAQLFARFGRKAKLSKTNNRKVLGRKRSDWIDILKQHNKEVGSTSIRGALPMFLFWLMFALYVALLLFSDNLANLKVDVNVE